MIKEKYIPKKLSDVKTNKKLMEAITKIKNSVKNETPVLISGPSGCGKTMLAKLVVKDLNLNILYYSQRDFKSTDIIDKIISQLTINSFFPTGVIIDDIEGFKGLNKLSKILNNTTIPLIMICNDLYRIPKDIRDSVNKVEIKPLYVTSVRKIMREIAKKEGLKFDAKNVSRDFRMSLNLLFNDNTELFVTKDPFTKIRDVFNNDINQVNLKTIDLEWIIGNIPNMLNGIDVCFAYDVLDVALRLNRVEVLKCLPKGGGIPEYPLYLRMIKQLKYKKQEEKK